MDEEPKSMAGKNTIILVAVHDKTRDHYLKLLKRYRQISLQTYSTLFHFRRESGGGLFSGFVVDIRTLIESPMEDKEFYASLCKGFPVLQIDYSSDHRDVNCLLEGDPSVSLKGKDLLDHYIRIICRKMTPRGVRLHTRQKVFFNAEVYSAPDAVPVPANLWDISDGGCFIVDSRNKNKPGDRVWLSIRGLSDDRLIPGEIRWTKPWGTSIEKLPGFGVSFLEVSESLQDGLKRIDGGG